jgi:predicted alpha/beta hydrolase
VITFDYRGTFDSLKLPDNKFFPKTKITLAHWAAGDVSSVIKCVYERYEREHSNIFYVGHSVGGQLLTLVDHNLLIHIRGFVAVAAQVCSILFRSYIK